jgi:ABC-type transporter Mla MlaB component
MLRITRVPRPGATPEFKLEGKLVAAWVDALREAAAAEGQAATGLGLDLSAVSYVDPAGVVLLRELIAAGARIVACRGLVAELLHVEVR